MLKAVCDVRLIALVLIKYWLDVDEICLDVCCSECFWICFMRMLHYSRTIIKIIIAIESTFVKKLLDSKKTLERRWFS